MKSNKPTLKGPLFETDAPKIIVLSPQNSAGIKFNNPKQLKVLTTENSNKSLLLRSPNRKYTEQASKASLSSLTISFDDIDDEEDENVLITSSKNYITQSSSNLVSITNRSETSSNEGNEKAILSSSQSDTIKKRKRASLYRKIRGSSIYPVTSPVEIPHEIGNILDIDNSYIELNEKNIKKIVLIQSVIRMYLVIKRIKNMEEKRLIDRKKLESDGYIAYNNELQRVNELVEKGKPCKEYDEAVEILNQYSDDIDEKGIGSKEEETKLEYLFYLCSEDETNTLFLHEFLILTNELMKLSTPVISYSMLFPEKNSKINLPKFLQWYRSCKSKGVKRSSLVY